MRVQRFLTILPLAFSLLSISVSGAEIIKRRKPASQVAGVESPLSTLNAKLKTKSFEPKRFSLLIPSVVVHGIQPDPEASAQMNRKVSRDGTTVITPGIGVGYESEEGLMTMVAGFKDCYDNLAGTFQFGKVFHLGSRTTWGLSVGLYVRETPMICEKSERFDGGGNLIQVTTCDSADAYPWKLMTQVNGEWVDIIPMPFLHFTTAIYKSPDFTVNLKVMSNFALNEFGLSVPF